MNGAVSETTKGRVTEFLLPDVLVLAGERHDALPHEPNQGTP
jgi:hypothetical protein